MPASNHKILNRALWTAQVLIALLFAFAGSVKFMMPPEKLQQGTVILPLAFIYFIGICEVLGALGMILPGLTRIRTALTPLAAAGLTIIMIGATAVTIIGGMPGAFVPAIIGIICSWIAYARTRIAPLADTPRRVLRFA
jgi:uncharacterized membrane protein YphA (DoxX/SURF4 family)